MGVCQAEVAAQLLREPACMSISGQLLAELPPLLKVWHSVNMC